METADSSNKDDCKEFFEHFLHPPGSYLLEALCMFGYNDVNYPTERPPKV